MRDNVRSISFLLSHGRSFKTVNDENETERFKLLKRIRLGCSERLLYQKEMAKSRNPGKEAMRTASERTVGAFFPNPMPQVIPAPSYTGDRATAPAERAEKELTSIAAVANFS
jgi:hypothetical protein